MSIREHVTGGWQVALLAVQTVSGMRGLTMLGLGVWLIVLGGSWYFALGGALLTCGAIATWRGRQARGVVALRC